jgi:uncharacterized protein
MGAEVVRAEAGHAEAEVVAGIADRWADLAAYGPLLADPRWLRAMDGRLGADPLTILVRERGRPVLGALATIQTAPRQYELFDLHHVLVTPSPQLHLTEESLARRRALAGHAPPAPCWTPYLLVMLPGYECVPVGPGADQPGLVAALVDAVDRFAAAEGIDTVAYLYVRPESAVLAAALATRGYTRVPLTHTWDMPVPADGMRGYLGAQPRKRRQEATREMRRLADAGVTIVRVPPEQARAAATRERLTALRCQLVRKYRADADEGIERRRLDDMIDEICGGTPEVFAAVSDEAMLGYALFAPWRDLWYCLSVGYDYADARSRMAYFATAYYGPLDAAASAGVRWLRYGIGAGAAKRARGCVGTPLDGWVRSANTRLDATVHAAAEITALR